MTPPHHELYVYYRVAQPQWRDATQAVSRWQRALCAARPGLQARVLRRPEAGADGTVTLMEAYAFASGSMDAVLEEALTRAADLPAPWRIGPRHCERFDPVE